MGSKTYKFYTFHSALEMTGPLFILIRSHGQALMIICYKTNKICISSMIFDNALLKIAKLFAMDKVESSQEDLNSRAFK